MIIIKKKVIENITALFDKLDINEIKEFLDFAIVKLDSATGNDKIDHVKKIINENHELINELFPVTDTDLKILKEKFGDGRVYDDDNDINNQLLFKYFMKLNDHNKKKVIENIKTLFDKLNITEIKEFLDFVIVKLNSATENEKIASPRERSIYKDTIKKLMNELQNMISFKENINKSHFGKAMKQYHEMFDYPKFYTSANKLYENKSAKKKDFLLFIGFIEKKFLP